MPDLTVPTATEFDEWVEAQGFNSTTLAAAIGCSYSSIWKWRTGRYKVDYTAWLACQYVAGGAADVRRRQRALQRVGEAETRRREGMRGVGDANRQAATTAARRA